MLEWGDGFAVINVSGHGVTQTAVLAIIAHVRCWPILLQKSQNAFRLIFRQKTKQATIASQCVHKRGCRIRLPRRRHEKPDLRH
jgi:hypothetical protein